MSDAFDKFQLPERGRFGDNESARPKSSGPRVTGASNLVDLDLCVHHKTEKGLLVSADGTEAKAQWLPLSQIEFVFIDGRYQVGTLKNGRDQEFAVAKVTLPEWLAVAKGLA